METVKDKVSSRWLHGLLEGDILACEAASCVGAGVIDLCAKADALLDIRTPDAEPDADSCVEEDFVMAICEAVSDQANVWYYG